MIQSFHTYWIMKAAELEGVKGCVPQVDTVFLHFKPFFITSRAHMKSVLMLKLFIFFTKIEVKNRKVLFPNYVL